MDLRAILFDPQVLVQADVPKAGTEPTYQGPLKIHGPINVRGDNARIHVGDAGASATSEEEQIRGQSNFRRSLCYQHMDSRKVQLSNIDAASFDWIWETNFSDWLAQNESLFWIYGKPASGKSTLVNWLLRSDELKRRLSTSAPCLVLEFYFDFRAGDNLENTTCGMLRSLLHQLTKIPELAHSLYQSRGFENESWLQGERSLIDAICNSLSKYQYTICAFIDGLDEYAGKLKDLMTCLMTLHRRNKMRMVIVSRPELMIERFMQGVPSLRTQDYNRATIKEYITTASIILSRYEIDQIGHVLHRVESKADGVILWARFIIDELLEAKIMGASIPELEEIVRTYPTELRDVYERLLNKIPVTLRAEAEVALRIIQLNRGSFLSYLFLGYFWAACTKVGNFQNNVPADITMKTFIARIHSMLGGLIEFLHVPSRCMIARSSDEDWKAGCTWDYCRASFVHETFGAYLKSSFSYEHLSTTDDGLWREEEQLHFYLGLRIHHHFATIAKDHTKAVDWYQLHDSSWNDSWPDETSALYPELRAHLHLVPACATTTRSLPDYFRARMGQVSHDIVWEFWQLPSLRAHAAFCVSEVDDLEACCHADVSRFEELHDVFQSLWMMANHCHFDAVEYVMLKGEVTDLPQQQKELFVFALSQSLPCLKVDKLCEAGMTEDEVLSFMQRVREQLRVTWEEDKVLSFTQRVREYFEIAWEDHDSDTSSV